MEQDPLIRQKQIEEELKRLAEEDRLGQEKITNAEEAVREATEALRVAGASPAKEERDVFGALLEPEKEKLKGPPRRLISRRLGRTVRNIALAGGLAASTGLLLRTGQKRGWWGDLGTQVTALKNRITGKRERAPVSPAAIRIAEYIGLDDVTKPLSDVINDKKIGLLRIIEGIIYNEGSSPKGVINNRGNIKYIGAPGQIDSKVKAADGGTFASYKTNQDGVNAIGALVMAAAQRGETFAYFIGRYTGTGGGENLAKTTRSPASEKIPTPERKESAPEEEQKPSPLVTQTQPEKKDAPVEPTQPPTAPESPRPVTEDIPPPTPTQPPAEPEKPKERVPRRTTAPVRVTTGTRVQTGTTVHIGGNPDVVEELREKIRRDIDAGKEPTGAVEINKGQGGSNTYFDTGAVNREILEQEKKKKEE